MTEQSQTHFDFSVLLDNVIVLWNAPKSFDAFLVSFGAVLRACCPPLRIGAAST